MSETPLRLIILMRLWPLMPYFLFNYYAGASYRFALWHNAVSLLFTIPSCFIWTGIGGAWIKYKLIPWRIALCVLPAHLVRPSRHTGTT